MPIRVTCPTCFYAFAVSSTQAGKRGLCPDCGGPIDVPYAASSGRSRRVREERVRQEPVRYGQPRDYPAPAAQDSDAFATFWLGAAVAAATLILVVVVGVSAFMVGRGRSNDAAPPPVAAAAPGLPPAGAAPVNIPPATGTPVSPPGLTPPVGAPAPVVPPVVSTTSTAPASTAPASTTHAAQVPAGSSPPAGLPVASPPGTSTTSTPAANPPESSQPAPAASPTPPARTFANAADLVEAVEPAVCRIAVEMAYGKSQGSGYVIDAANGIIATNYHVLADADKATVIFPDKSETPVLGVLKLDAKKDIALIKIDPPKGKTLIQVPLATEHPRKGEEVIAIGAPLGFDFSVSEGKISAIRTSEEIIYAPHEMDGTWIQTTTPISPGNSGGPLFNMRGEVVAMNTMTYTTGQNLNFCISALDVQDAYSKRSQTLTALSPQTVPGSAQQSSGPRETVVDGTKTDEGRDLLADIDEAMLIVGYFAFDPTGRVAEFVKSMAERTCEKSDIEITPTENALMLVTMDLTGVRDATAGTQALTISAHVLVRTRGEGGKPRVVKVWEDEATVGTISLSSLVRGVIPRTTQSNVTSFFNKFRSDVLRSRRELENPASSRR